MDKNNFAVFIYKNAGFIRLLAVTVAIIFGVGFGLSLQENRETNITSFVLALIALLVFFVVTLMYINVLKKHDFSNFKEKDYLTSALAADNARLTDLDLSELDEYYLRFDASNFAKNLETFLGNFKKVEFKGEETLEGVLFYSTNKDGKYLDIFFIPKRQSFELDFTSQREYLMGLNEKLIDYFADLDISTRQLTCAVLVVFDKLSERQKEFFYSFSGYMQDGANLQRDYNFVAVSLENSELYFMQDDNWTEYDADIGALLETIYSMVDSAYL
ncbi:MAG: hypothetical protein FWB72_07400 [Firmicutes bacterium]|nr:hypothetical protein [Bacillota bacterium]